MSATPLTALAQVVRSKNAGPTQLTIDVFFRDAAAYAQGVGSPSLSTAAVATLYDVPAGQMQRHAMPDILALKFTLPRRICAGDPGDGDVYGAQQHAPLLGVMV